ncbi:TetR family transcriptional regulator [Spongiactinospora gelatinilytica]|uniref:TetR family transcriptional regulator n=1 Tax=Spongiactinospora gelatinilytica TaxID=2666298 RepID=A0A2W2G4T8_9ACTN|nr:TetR/AcrR family transcriptional regulator [Spongiactinospora gelatinilytica]PZG37439.1 TetR family transcriptional regulator [Spongiactinospora gelatinilytica]
MAKGRYHHGDLRSALLDAAETLVRERGADDWSLREASARVGVSPSAAYHHFASRDALVRALSERTLAWLGKRLGQECERVAGQADDPQRRLIALGRGYVTWALDDPAMARLVLRGGATGPDSAISPHPHDVLSAELDRLAEAGGLPAFTRPGAEFVLWAAIHGLAVLLADGLVRIDDAAAVDAQTERVVRAALNGLARETSPAADRPAARSAHTERLARRATGEPH